MLIDTHVHLNDEVFNIDLPQVVETARGEGIEFMINVGYSIEACRRGLELASKYREIYAAVGIHPHEAGGVNEETYKFLISAARIKKVVAIGEMGLDYYRNFSPHKKQQEVFRRQIFLAKELKLPIIVHDRDAHADVVHILRSEAADRVEGVLHCFSGDVKMVRECLDMGFYISIAGPVTFKNAGQVKEVAAFIPLNRLLVETDCPYLSPEPYRGKRNEPARVRLVAQKIANIKGLSMEEIEAATTENAKRLFKLPE